MPDDRAEFHQALQLRLARFSYLASMHLFDRGEREREPARLSERMQPRLLGDLLGRPQLQRLAELIDEAKASGRLRSLLIWGPPGSGKTALARLIVEECGLRIERVDDAARDEASFTARIEQAVAQRELDGSSTVLFIEAVDRCPKPRLQTLFSHLDRGALSVCATTADNPWVNLPTALLGRMHIVELTPLGERDLIALLERALRDTGRGLGDLGLRARADALGQIAHLAQGDARLALDLLESAARLSAEQGSHDLAIEHVQAALAAHGPPGPRPGENPAELERAFGLALRSGDPDAALYWMLRMLKAGEVPAFIVRRMILFASEDIGNADPNALELAMTTADVLERLGMPEALRSMGQCCVYLASAPKSDAAYQALQRAERDVREHGSLPVPSAPGELATLLPDSLSERRYYCPSEQGFEARLRDRLKPRAR